MSNLNSTLQSANKTIGAILAGGIVTLLVGLGVIPSSVGNTILALLGAAAAALGAYLAPKNKPLNTNRDG